MFSICFVVVCVINMGRYSLDRRDRTGYPLVIITTELCGSKTELASSINPPLFSPPLPSPHRNMAPLRYVRNYHPHWAGKHITSVFVTLHTFQLSCYYFLKYHFFFWWGFSLLRAKLSHLFPAINIQREPRYCLVSHGGHRRKNKKWCKLISHILRPTKRKVSLCVCMCTVWMEEGK